MIDSRHRRGALETVVIVALFAASFGVSYMAMRAYRAAGVEPLFYQTNFGPAVMTACGRGFGVALSNPPALQDFLQVKRDDFDCSLLPAALQLVPLTSAANANWYYLYGTAAVIWRVTGVSWRALDILVAAFGGAVTLLLYGLFRLVTVRGAAAPLSLLLTVSPANLMRLLSLRDYSKAPFVLAAILILAVMVLRPMRRAGTLWMAALYGAVVGLGYGFRSDLAVMVPFGACVVLLLLPGSLRANAVRNALATSVLLAGFFVAAWPVISGLELGGCQYHFALLGLTTPNTRAMNLAPPLYRFGDYALDIFGSLKVGDYASRVMHQRVPDMCGAQFDVASGHLYMQMVRMFPADFVVRAYGSVLMILRLGFLMPVAMPPWVPFPSSAAMASLYRMLEAMTTPLAPWGLFVTLAAIAAAWAVSARLGVALTVFVLFLTGYPAIRFEERHWLHLRFIPWWAVAMVVGQILQRGVRGWGRPALMRAAIGVAGLLAVLAASLTVLRVVQARSVRRLIVQYLAAPTEEIPVERQDGSMLPVRWQPRDYGRAPEHQGSDLVVVTLDASHCAGTGPVTLMVRYDIDTRDGGHDLSTSFVLARPEVGAEPTRVFVPVFWAGFQDETILRFSGKQSCTSSARGRTT